MTLLPEIKDALNQHTIIEFSAGNLTEDIIKALDLWQKENNTQRLWDSDATLWTNKDESNWTGWLNEIALEQKEIPKIETFVEEVVKSSIKDIVLMGMGGSSLCPAMMAKTFGKMPGFPKFHILDSTDPMQIRHLENQIDLINTLFIISSKSGSTLEPNIFKDYFTSRLQTILNKKNVGDAFIAITDPGTTLAKLASTEKFKHIFYGIPSIGGRYSALSNFGMVPAGLIGVDVSKFLSLAETMKNACSPNFAAKDNPGVSLGVILGVCAKQGKDKVTFIVSPVIAALGAWLEQLLAESTGKGGKGLIPVDLEPLGQPTVYSDDRVFVYIRLTEAPDLNQDRGINQLEQAGFVVVKLNLTNKMHLGAELFRWEIATAVIGSLLKIDPFNQPDVEQSKVLSLQLTKRYEETGKLQKTIPVLEESGLALFTNKENLLAIENHLNDKPSLVSYLRAHLNRVDKGDYVDISAFIEMSTEHLTLLQNIRTCVRDTKKVATCLGFGPRFLHSTGQDYKGGPNTGIFLQVTADYNEDIQVPGHQYTFGVVIAAQAAADFSVLTERNRRVLRIHLGKDIQGGLRNLEKAIKTALVD